MLNGFLILRKPEHYDRTPHLSGEIAQTSSNAAVRYRGVMRDWWDEVETARIERRLPEEIKAAYSRIVSHGGFGNVPLCTSLEDLKLLWSFTRSQSTMDEIVGVFCPVISRYIGEISVNHDSWRFLGFDVALLNGHSLLDEGYFVAPEEFQSFSGHINRNGLLDDESLAPLLVQKYLELEQRCNLEPINGEDDETAESPVAVSVYLAEQEIF